ncbi:MAG: Hsp20/alpha crystallin family protein [Lentisphaerae bacterium]|nr:Hsp20/alpha crystallin family protein [Lentisphaerota bacterium]
MAKTEVVKRDDNSTKVVGLPETGTVYIPDVDISENGESVRLVADMPGVDQQSVDVTVENNVLTIEGNACTPPPQGYEALGREYAVGKYRRTFTLSHAVDTEGIKAGVRQGVLEVTLPKREAVKTRKIAIGG